MFLTRRELGSSWDRKASMDWLDRHPVVNNMAIWQFEISPLSIQSIRRCFAVLTRTQFSPRLEMANYIHLFIACLSSSTIMNLSLQVVHHIPAFLSKLFLRCLSKDIEWQSPRAVHKICMCYYRNLVQGDEIAPNRGPMRLNFSLLRLNPKN